MWPRKAHKVRPSRHQDRIDVIRLVNIANRHGRHMRLVPDPVGKRRLEHAAIDGPCGLGRLTGGHVANINIMGLQHPGDLDRFFGRHALIPDPVICRNTHR